MSKEQARQDIAGYLKTNWATTAIDFPNQKFEQPSTAWLRLGIVFGDDSQISMGSSYDVRTELVIALTIFTKIDSGSALALGYADKLTPLFRAKVIGTVQTRMPSTNIIGENGDWYMTNVLVPAWIDTII